MVVLLIMFIHFRTHNIRVTQEASQTPLGRRFLLTILRLSPSSAASIESQQQRCRGAFQGYREVGCHGRRRFCWLKLVWKWNINLHRKWSVHQWTWELKKSGARVFEHPRNWGCKLPNKRNGALLIGLKASLFLLIGVPPWTLWLLNLRTMSNPQIPVLILILIGWVKVQERFMSSLIVSVLSSSGCIIPINTIKCPMFHFFKCLLITCHMSRSSMAAATSWTNSGR